MELASDRSGLQHTGVEYFCSVVLPWLWAAQVSVVRGICLGLGCLP